MTTNTSSTRTGAPQLTFDLDLGVPPLPALVEAPGSAAATPEWFYCENYCRGPINRYRLTLWPGQAREWTDAEEHRMCAECSTKTIAIGNRLSVIQPV